MPVNTPSPSAALAHLHDIHLPAKISWWPLAPAWYGLFALVILGFLVIIFLYYQRQRKRRLLKHALQQLDDLKQAYQQQTLDTSETVEKISSLLKRIVKLKFPAVMTAGLSGERWVEFLNQQGRDALFTAELATLLQTAAYQAHSQADVLPLFTVCEQWLKENAR